MPTIPHEYIVIDNYPSKSKIIAKFIDLIAKEGYTQTFYDKEYRYLEINGYKYWVIGNTRPTKLPRSGIINRAKI